MEPTLGIRREDKSQWERRAPLAPYHVKALLEEHGIRTVIQPSQIRVFTDDEYRAAGAVVDEDLSSCNLVVAVKEIPIAQLRPGGRYLYFAHVIKGQPYNMPMLRHLLDEGCTLLDHEKIVDENGRRLVLFSYHAGLAGMIDSLWALGRRLASKGIETPLAQVEMAYQYGTLDRAEEAMAAVGEALADKGFSESLGPVVVGLAGYGNVSRGAQRILGHLNPERITPEELGEELKPGRLYQVIFEERHMAAPREPGEAFDLRTYYRHPERFEGIFEQYLDHLTMLVNCIYWEDRYPRLVTLDRLRADWSRPEPPKLEVIGDISCDIGGAIEATVKPTQPDAPVYVYDPIAGEPIEGVEGRGPVIMAVDNLPCELPRESTTSFGDALAPLLPEAVKADWSVALDELSIPEPLRRAVIVHKGELTPSFRYLEKYLG